MAIGIDTSKWKPRKLIGTPANSFSIKLAVGILCFGAICGVTFHFASVTKNLRKAVEVLYEDPIEEVERKIMISSGMPNRSADSIRRLLEEKKRIDKPDV